MLGFCGEASAATQDLDSYSSAGAAFVGPVTFPTIPAGERQIAQIQGTISLWAPTSWTSYRAEVCGPALSAPIFPSPGRPSGPSGVDADSKFGPLIFKDKKTCAGQVAKFGGIQLSTGGAFSHPDALPASDASTHTYQYALVGTGAPAQFRIADRTAADNYGVFRITTRPAVGSDCVGTGAALLGYPSEAACQTALGDAPAQQLPVAPVPSVFPASVGATSTTTGTSKTTKTIVPCRSSRAFTIRLKEPKSRRLKSARLYYKGKLIAKAYRRKSDKRLVGRIKILKNKPKGLFTIRIKAIRTNGKRVNGFRRYRTCAGNTAPNHTYFNRSLL
jgi:hypothetical protein